MKRTISKALCLFITVVIITTMTTSIFAYSVSPAAYNQYSGNLNVGFANMSCNLTTYSTSAAANMYRDTTYSNFSLSLGLYGSYYDSSLGMVVSISDSDNGIDENLHTAISSTQYGDLLNVSAQYHAQYLSNTSYAGSISLP